MKKEEEAKQRKKIEDEYEIKNKKVPEKPRSYSFSPDFVDDEPTNLMTILPAKYNGPSKELI